MSDLWLRPDVTCAFEVMDRCEEHFGPGAVAHACREGARDAHLLSPQQWRFATAAEQTGYEAGQFTTHRDCGTAVVATHQVPLRTCGTCGT